VPTIYEVARILESKGSPYLSRDTLRFFGQRLRDFRVRVVRGAVYIYAESRWHGTHMGCSMALVDLERGCTGTPAGWDSVGKTKAQARDFLAQLKRATGESTSEEGTMNGAYLHLAYLRGMIFGVNAYATLDGLQHAVRMMARAQATPPNLYDSIRTPGPLALSLKVCEPRTAEEWQIRDLEPLVAGLRPGDPTSEYLQGLTDELASTPQYQALEHAVGEVGCCRCGARVSRCLSHPANPPIGMEGSRFYLCLACLDWIWARVPCPGGQVWLKRRTLTRWSRNLEKGGIVPPAG
jgi:hypothetical protein